MSVSTLHPSYSIYAEHWETLRDFYNAPDDVRLRGEKYLPATEGMRLDGMGPNEPGYVSYKSYQLRARVPTYISDAVEVITGLLHQKAAIIELPPELEYLRENASDQGENIYELYRRINVEQILLGRVGLYVDMPPKGVGEPYISVYSAESIINWSYAGLGKESALTVVVLNESGNDFVKEDMQWRDVTQYRVLSIEDGVSSFAVTSLPGDSYHNLSFVAQEYRGRPLDNIPFVFINSKDLLPDIDRPPLKGLADMCIGIYQSEADYRRHLHYQAEETLVVIGGVRSSTTLPSQPDSIRVGAGARIDVDQGGDAKYIGVKADGLAEERSAIDADRKRAQIKAGELIQNSTSQNESGQALSTRFNAQTATLNQLAATAAGGLEKALRFVAMFKGANPDLIKITPNTEFIDFSLEGANFKHLLEAKGIGLPLSLRSLHALAADRGLTALDFDTEMKNIAEEKPLVPDTKPKEELPDET